MLRSVDPLNVRWLGIVSGVAEPSSFRRSMEMCSRSRTTTNPNLPKAARTRALGASDGNFGIRELGLCDECLDRRVVQEGLAAEGLDVEANRGSHVGKCRIVRFPLADDRSSH